MAGRAREVREGVMRQARAEQAQVHGDEGPADGGEGEQVNDSTTGNSQGECGWRAESGASIHWKNGRSIFSRHTASTGAAQTRRPLDERGLRLVVAVEPVVGDDPAGEDDEAPQGERRKSGEPRRRRRDRIEIPV